MREVDKRLAQPVPEVVYLPAPQPDQVNTLQQILASPLFSAERSALEKSYASQAKGLEDIDRGFWVIQSQELRARLLDLRHQLRQAGHPLLISLPEAQARWAKNYQFLPGLGIHPETLAACLDSYPVARRAIASLRDQLRPDLKDQAISIDDLMINPGGMAALSCYETGWDLGTNLSYGFSNIGGNLAALEINQTYLPTALNSLNVLALRLRADTGLYYHLGNIIGSERGNPALNASGGAIGMQFMPDNALRLYDLLSEAGFKFNPFHLQSSLVAAWVFLARQEIFEGGGIRYGYRRNFPVESRLALAKWNPLTPQINSVYKAAVNYFDNFLKT